MIGPDRATGRARRSCRPGSGGRGLCRVVRQVRRSARARRKPRPSSFLDPSFRWWATTLDGGSVQSTASARRCARTEVTIGSLSGKPGRTVGLASFSARGHYRHARRSQPKLNTRTVFLLNTWHSGAWDSAPHSHDSLRKCPPRRSISRSSKPQDRSRAFRKRPNILRFIAFCLGRSSPRRIGVGGPRRSGAVRQPNTQD